MEKISYDYSLLRGLIVTKCGGLNKFVDLMNKNGESISQSTFSLKVNSKYSFDQDEILMICKYLDIDHCDIPKYFFDRNA